MNTLLESSSTATVNAGRPPQRRPMLEISRGARLLRIHEPVHLDAAVPEDYAEPDRTLGHNVIGLVLHVLRQHLANAPGGGGDEQLSVALIRREDGRAVEVIFRLSRTRRAGQPCLILARAGERADA